MFRFAKPDGKSFDLDYCGPVHAFSSGNDLIAICRGEEKIAIEIEDEEIEEVDSIGCPEVWFDWEILLKISETREVILQRALATAWCAMTLCERLTIKDKCRKK